MTTGAVSFEELVDLLRCPTCRGDSPLVNERGEAFRCPGCGTAYPIQDGIPMLLVPELLTSLESDGDHELAHKRQQMAFFDQDVEGDFGITRPRGAPALYGWLLAEKMRRGLLGLQMLEPGMTTLTVCGGSGIDAEFLARSGLRVILSDISRGVARQAQERARRFGLPLTVIVADAENLPFRDRSIELVCVHDGLHHLSRPLDGLLEMARVAGRAVSVNEPADATITRLGVRLGFAMEREEAGNPVERLRMELITAALASADFHSLNPHRYALYLHHEPGPVTHALSRTRVLPLAQLGFRVLNSLIGRWGNKLTVQAVRVPLHGPKEASTPATARRSPRRSR